MKKNIRKLFLLLAVVITALVCFAVSVSALDATGQCGDNVYWEYNSSTGELVISGTGPMTDYEKNSSPFYNSNIKSVVINNGVTTIGDFAFYYSPSLKEVTIGDSVTTIGNYVFALCNRLTNITVDEKNQYFSNDEYGVLFNKDKTKLIQYSLGNTRTAYTIPDSVTAIGFSAFSGCRYLVEITIPDNATTIGGSAFYDCHGLAKITIPYNITAIGDYAFCECYKLTGIIVDEKNQYFSNDEYGVLFNKDKTKLIQFPIANKKTSYTIPDSVTTIGSSAFSYCYSLTEVTIPDSVAEIPSRAFYYCNNITEFTIPNSVTTIDALAFFNCFNLTDVYYGGTKEQWNNIYISQPGNENLTEANIYFNYIHNNNGCTHPNKINHAQQDATCTANGYTDGVFCSECEAWIGGHEIIPMKEHKDTNGDKICDDCNSVALKLLRTGYCGEKVIYAWYEDGKVVITGEGPMLDYKTGEMGESPFYGSDIKSVVINNGVTTIGAYAFYDCDSLTEVTIGDSVTTIGDYAFYNCYSLTEVTIPDSVTTIGDYAFSGVYYMENLSGGLTKVTIGNSVTTIGDYAFSYCYSLTEVTIPDSVTTIGDYAFYDCDSLTDVYYGGTEERWNKINISWFNESLTDANIHFNYAPGSITKPSSITPVQSTTSAIKLTWPAVPDAVGYRVYQKVNNGWKALGNVTKTSATLTKLTAGTKYTFAVQAIFRVNGALTLADDYTTITTATKTAKPAKVAAAQNTSAIKLAWTKVTGADGYRIYYKSGNTWKVCVNSTTATSHTFKNLKAGAKYTFTIQPYIKTSGGVVWGEYAEFMTATKPAAPASKVSSPSKGRISLTFGAVNGADGYQVWYKTGNGAYKLYKTYGKTGTINFSNLKSGTKYTFAVRAGIKTSGGNIFGAYKEAVVTVK